jgi:hypothetical protein
MAKWFRGFAVLAVTACLAGSVTSAPEAPPGRRASDGEIAEITDRIIESSQLTYVSDYFSFVGEDAQGHVSFAIDNNRGRDGAQYQAEHFVVLHDEQAGFIDVPGFTRYANPQGELRGIPDSERFRFAGSRRTGLTIRSQQTGAQQASGPESSLELAMDPIELKVGRVVDDRAIFYMGSAPATLKWNSRTLEGRVIEEYLVVKDWNRISRSQLGVIFSSVSFQGLYLKTPAAGDLYIHSIGGRGLAPVGPAIARLGLYSEAGATEELDALELVVQRKEQGLGLFRWPVAWTATWQTPGRGAGRLAVEVVDFKRIGSFLLGGFGMAIVKGSVEQDGKQIPVYGWGEIILWNA